MIKHVGRGNTSLSVFRTDFEVSPTYFYTKDGENGKTKQ